MKHASTKLKRRVPILVAYSNLISRSNRADFESMCESPLLDVLLDSGAFSAFRSGEPIDLDEYIDFLKRFKSKLWGYFALDVIGEKKETLRNLKIMRKAGLNPIPVFTVGNTKKDMEVMFDGAEILGIGGIQPKIWPYSRAHRLSYLKQIKGWARRRKIHLLGVASEKILRTFKPYSCDTSAWLDGARFGKLSIYFGNGRWRYLNTDDRHENIDREVELELSRAGFSVPDLLDQSVWNNRTQNIIDEKSVLVHLTCRSWIKYVMEYEARFKTKIFMVTSTALVEANDYPIFLQARKLLGEAK